jgi:hypothetical protein
MLVVPGEFFCYAACCMLRKDWCVKDVLEFFMPQCDCESTERISKSFFSHVLQRLK